MNVLKLTHPNCQFKINLRGKNWVNSQEKTTEGHYVLSWSQGFAFELNSEPVSVDHARMNALVSKQSMLPLSSQLTGHYCFLRILSTHPFSEEQEINSEFSIEVHCDRLRSFPMFYYQDENLLWLSDDLFWLAEQLRTHSALHLNPLGILSMWRTAQLVSGSDTILAQIKQSQASDLLIWRNGHLSVSKGEQYIHQEDEKLEVSTLKAQLKEAAQRFTQRLIHYANGAQIVVPLSGGFDSRLVLTALVEAQYPKLFAFTYGRHYSGEVKLSEQIATQLNVPWQFVQYTPKKWKHWKTTLQCEKLFHQARSTSVLAHIQDPMAIDELVQSGHIEPDSVIACGHSGDVHAGSLIDQKSLNTALHKTAYIELLCKKYYRFQAELMPPLPASAPTKSLESLKTQLKAKLAQELSSVFTQGLTPDGSIVQREKLIDELERWFCVERCSKYLVASMRAYEIFGLKWWLPLWDDAFTQVWLSVPLKHRGRFSVYHEFVNEYFEEISKSTAPKASVRHTTAPKVHPIKALLLKLKWVQVLRFRQKHPFAWYAFIPFLQHLRSASPQEHINVHLIQDEIQWWLNYERSKF